ncbi:AraC family ligand binding domain-containing protein [Paenibacillus aurantiacus]|uniref:AraC family ligand binding domain-containing protein n=1 Tax=Paenibacillus aurantiacus TaxID=1936118 RepID=A0ABV5KSN1_9BACL
MEVIMDNGHGPAGHDPVTLRLLFYGLEHCPPGHAWGPGLRDAFIVHYVHRGRGHVHSKGRTYTLEAGSGFLIVPGKLIHYEADSYDPWTYAWIGFNGLEAHRILAQSGMSDAHPVFRAAAPSYFENFYDECLSASRQRGADLLLQSILYRFLAELINTADDATDTRPVATKETYIRQAVEWIGHHYSQRITVEEIARKIGLNRTYLSSLFQERLGMSLQGYLLHVRMKQAAELLRQPELSVSDVSRSVGYLDPFLFSKMFKKTVGQSPSQYRKLLDTDTKPDSFQPI